MALAIEKSKGNDIAVGTGSPQWGDRIQAGGEANKVSETPAIGCITIINPEGVTEHRQGVECEARNP